MKYVVIRISLLFIYVTVSLSQLSPYNPNNSNKDKFCSELYQENLARYRCNCRPTCVIFGDCCIKNDTNNLFTNIKIKPSCIYNPKYDNNSAVYVFNKCYKVEFQGSPSIIEQCENGNALPVYTSDGLLFKNYQCALCNKIDNSSIHHGNVIPKTARNKCFRNAISRCPENAEVRVARDCENEDIFYTSCMGDLRIFKNKHCAECNISNECNEKGHVISMQ